VHLGLGNFFRAHSAWYTEHAGNADDWGIAAFSGRSATHVAELEAQGCLYTLVQQSGSPTSEVISSIVAVHTGSDLDAWRSYFASPDLQIVTSTITEAGYVRDSTGGLDLKNDGVAADAEALKADPLGGAVTTAPGKFVAGLLVRRAADAGKLTFVPCDNVVDNGPMTKRVIADLIAVVDPSLQAWVDANVGYVTTMVDRITPRPTPADVVAAEKLTGVADEAVVVTEPFTEWVLEGEFAGSRPEWEAAGATFVDDIRPFEHRKLWLLNGSHSLMAYAGPILGKETVGDAIADPTLRGWVEEWWDVAARHLPLAPEQIQAYRDALVERFTNPAIRHLLAQIAADGSQKIPIRFVPALKADLAENRLPSGATRAIAAWTLHLRGRGVPLNDFRASEVAPLGEGSVEESVGKVLGYLGVNDQRVYDEVRKQIAEIERAAG
jgi:fructuronate reductase